MKRITTFIMAIIIAFSMTFVSSASTTTGNIIEINDITVIFSASSNLTEEEQQLIAEYVVFGVLEDDTSTTYNLLCTLFGHKTTTEAFTVVEHCVSDTQPRCRRSLQDVTTCSRCDYVATDVVSAVYIYCCE